MAFSFSPARREKAKARLALTGPAGSGKTLGALYIAAGLVPKGRIAVIDTENQSASLYAGKEGVPPYDVCVLAPPFHPKRYTEALRAAEAAGYDIIIIDSLSHAWMGTGGVLEIKDTIASGKNQNSYTAWNEAGRLNTSLLDAILASPVHVIATIRSKQDYSQEKDDRGKTIIKKLGMAPQAREGTDYEFGIVLDISIDHTASSTKDRSGLFDGSFFKITPDVGAVLAKWLNDGVAPSPPPPAPSFAQVIDAVDEDALAEEFERRAKANGHAETQRVAAAVNGTVLIDPRTVNKIMARAKELGEFANYGAVYGFIGGVVGAGGLVKPDELSAADAEKVLAALADRIAAKEAAYNATK